ncbi:MAG: hypothetical protein HY097_08450 [Nitrospinae bacterium]|nr:hypothetical protein [Nitrospinota bacterium]
MGKKSYLKQIESLEKRIAEHLEKIERERNKSIPGEKRIMYWQKEIDKFNNEIIKSEKRLKRG